MSNRDHTAAPDGLRIAQESPRLPDVVALLERHLAQMHATSPRDCVHALDVDALCVPAITFWTARIGDVLAGCGALKEIDATHGEIKSMHTATEVRGQGVGRRLANTILDASRARSYSRVSLETGSTPDFDAARRLYRSLGFLECGPFAGYVVHPHSVFMTLALHG